MVHKMAAGKLSAMPRRKSEPVTSSERDRKALQEAAELVATSPADGFTVEAFSDLPYQVDYSRMPRCVHEWMAQHGEWPEQSE
jgi:hypothetical protein